MGIQIRYGRLIWPMILRSQLTFVDIMNHLETSNYWPNLSQHSYATLIFLKNRFLKVRG